MAGVGEKPAPPAVHDSFEQQIQMLGIIAVLSCCAAAALCPGIALGAGVYWLWCWLREPRRWLRLACVAVSTLAFAWLNNALVVGWLWADWFAHGLTLGDIHIKAIGVGAAIRSFAVETLVGPAALELSLLGYLLWSRSLGAQIRRDQRADTRRWRAVSGRRQLHAVLARRLGKRPQATTGHPAGFIRLGINRESEEAFDLELPRELASHVLLAGVTGAGKTNTEARLVGGALANRYGAIFIDCKGTDLKEPARLLAQRYRLPFYLVDPDDPASLGYNPCSGDAAAIANKLIGAFSYGEGAEIYKNIAMEAIPLVARGLLATGHQVTLEALYHGCDPRVMLDFSHRMPPGAEDRIRQRLFDLGDNPDKLTKQGYAGLQRRFGALLEGKFGDLFRSQNMLDWDTALARPSVVYIALSTLASSEDVELMGRVIAQDIKQVCARRLQMIARGHSVVPFIVDIDEFAALREAEQLTDLPLQARAALMSIMVATQYLPESYALRKSLLGSGLIISHRVEAEDSDSIAAALGTYSRTELTNQLDFETGFASKGSVRHVEAYAVHPNDLRDFRTGYVAVRSFATHRSAIVHVFPASA
jgi:hypothetical protein